MDDADGSHQPQGGSNAAGTAKTQTTAVGNNASGAKLRKRTKTGCLTCRKRRIKCGEERPSCQNCRKSKRLCEGYNQRLNWKPPVDWTGLGDDGQTMQYHNGMLGPTHYRPVPPPINTDGFMPIRMQPGQPYGIAENGEPLFSPPHTAGSYMQSFNGLPMASPQTPLPPTWTPMTPQYTQHPFGQGPMTSIPPSNFPPDFSNIFQQSPTGVPMSARPMPSVERHHHQPQYHAETPSVNTFQTSAPSTQTYATASLQGISASVAPTHTISADSTSWWDQGANPATQQVSSGEVSWVSPVSNGESISPNFSSAAPIISPTAVAPNAARHLGPSSTGITAQLLEDAAIESFDDNYYDVEPDEEMDDISENASRQLTLMRRLHEENFTELSMRSYNTYLYNNMLVDYQPEEHANPLNNPTTARVFAHFISATGPSLSIFERHPRNPSALFNETFSGQQQGIWTYTLPMKAMYNQGLLQAMLALASLHISKLQNIQSNASYRHYAYAIKNIHKRVGNPKQGLLPTTIAATLLLGFYEILTADHLKWSSHLAGAKQLLQAIDFKGMAREAKKVKEQQLAQKDQFAFYDNGFNPAVADFSANIDENLVSSLMGTQVSFEKFGQVLDEEEPSKPSKPFDMERYELYQDLYWWYARQDVYQAILSGNKLLLDYHKWTDCPPRASMGRSDAIFGTHDHLLLVFARIADFTAKDRKRKVRLMNANGGHWRPPPGMNLGGPPNQGPGGQPQGPPHGMAQGMPQAPQGMPSQGNYPNMPFNHSGVPPQPYGQHMQPQQVGGPGPNPFMQQSHSQMPPEFPGNANGSAMPPFMQGPPPQSAMGTSPNFKHERAFTEASPNAAFSGQASMGPPPQTPNNMRRGSLPGGTQMPPPQPPAFYGMAPLPTTVNMPSSYAAHGPDATPSPKSEKGEIDLDLATQKALKEWQDLKVALHTWESHLGPHYQPLPPDLHPPTITPFGPALFYRSHDIGILWAMYYMACIILERAHPHMPPAAMMAAGVAARQTTLFATRIGQIVGGIVPPIMGDLSPNLGACLCEASLPLFFAGVQYQDPDQRTWLVALLRNVEERTGWKSIGMVAQGCETAWEKAFEMKRGPPYKRKFDQWHVDTAYDSRVARITGNYTAIDHDHPDIAGKVPRDHQGTRVHWAMGILGVVEDGDEKESRHISGVQPSKEPVNN